MWHTEIMLNGVSSNKLERNEGVQHRSLQAVQDAAKRQMRERGIEDDALPQSEQVALSREILDDTESQKGHSGLDALLATLGQGLNPKMDQKLDQKVNEVGEASASKKQSGPQQQPKRELEARWKPSTEPGKVHKSYEKIGDVSAKLKTQKPKDTRNPEETSVVQGVRASASSKGAPKTSAPRPVGQVEANKQSRPDQKPGQRLFPRQPPKAPDRITLSDESKQQLQPLQQVGQPEVARRLEQKAQQQKPGQEEEIDLGTEEIQTKAETWNQSAVVRPEGDVKPGDILRWYQKLDGIDPAVLETIQNAQNSWRVNAGDKAQDMGLDPQHQQRLKSPQAIQS